MSEEPVNTIRESNRNILFLNRRRQKDEETDLRRSLANLRLNPSNVTAVINKLKTKASISASELKLLQNALIDNPKNIEVMLNTHGTLRGLVRELTGHDVSKQIASCGCLCNLALGDSKAGHTISKAAGVYLVAALDNMTSQLAVTCAWTLGNLGGSGARACDVIAAQGAFAKLCDVTRGGEGEREAALYTLTHVTYVLKDELTPEHLFRIVQCLSQIDIDTATSHLLFIISCHKEFYPGMIPESYLNKIIEKFTQSLERHVTVCKRKQSVDNSDQKCCDYVYLVRVLANMDSLKVYNDVIGYFMTHTDLVTNNVRRLLQIDEDKSLWWLLGNMLNCCGHSEFLMRLLCPEN